MIAFLVLLLALAPPAWWRETNSHAASARAAKEYEAKQYRKASADYGRAAQLAPSPRSSFNLGTAQIAAGQREQGAASLEPALAEPALRADAYFNRGNGALAAKAWEYAIRDYADALRANPRHAAAKRNLEIALRRREEQQRQQQKGGGGERGPQKNPQPQPSPGRQKPKEGELDLDALLRSVQQQEQEELRRMKGRQGETRVGW
jgi:Ca-activated chloride channel family protein